MEPSFYWRTYRAILASAAAHPFDVLHVQNKHSLPGAFAAAKRLGFPLAYTIRDLSILCSTGQCLMAFPPVHPQCGRTRFWWQTCRPLFMHSYVAPQPAARLRATLGLLRYHTYMQLYRACLARVDGVIGVSAGILQVYQSAHLRTGRQATVVYNLPPQPTAVDEGELDRLRHKYGLANRRLVLYAGKLSLGKGTQVLADAAGAVAAQVSDVLFLFVGDGPLHTTGAHSRVLGRVPHAELLSLYHLADLVVIPSVWPEPMSRVGLEAMAVGKPLVGTSVGGTPEQIEDGISGLLVPRRDPVALAAAILRILTDDDLRRHMGEAALRLLATKFSRPASIAKLVAFYSTLAHV
jgi:glycosyltransferase involved in cell wall biosynthesis